MFHFSQLAWKFANQGTMQLTTRNEFSEDIDLKMSLLGDVKAPPCPLGCLFGAISPLSYGHFSWFQMYSPASWWKGDQYLSLGERNSRERGWHTKLCVQWQKSQLASRSSQKSGMPHSRMHCIPNLYSYVHNGYCQHYQVKLPPFFCLINTCPQNTPPNELQQWAFPLHFLGNFAIIALLHTLQPWGERWSSSLYSLVTSHDNSSQPLVACQHFPTQIVMISWALNLNAKKVDFPLWSYAVSDAQQITI